MNQRLNQQPSVDLTEHFWQALQQQMMKTPRPATWLVQHSRNLRDRFTQHYHALRWLPHWARRRWQLKLGASLAGVALALALTNTPVAYAAGITVTTDAPAINTADGQCSLIEAIVNANDDAATYGDCAGGSGADIITLDGGTYGVETINNGQNGLPLITSAITIDGNSATIVRDGPSGMLYRLFEVATTGELTLNHATVTGGGAVAGGAIYNRGILTLSNSTVKGNTSEFENGGGIFNNGGAVTLTDSTVNDNSARSGGGIFNSGGTLTLHNSTVSGNTAIYWDGAGIVNNNGGVIALTNSTVSGNDTIGYDGGGILNSSGVITLTNSTVSNNRADSGGGIRNVSGTLTLINTIVANSHGGDCARNGGTINVTRSLIEGGLGCVNGTNTSNLTGDPKLGSLESNGGATFNHALLAGSPALDAAGNSGPATDQRDVARPQGSAFDMGAFEAEVVNSSVTQQSASATYNATPQSCAATGSSLPIYTIVPTLRNNSATTLANLFFRVKQLEYVTAQGGQQPSLCNATTVVNNGGVGSILAIPNSSLPGDDEFNPGEVLSPTFVIGLPVRAGYRFFIDLYTSSATAAQANGESEIGEYLGSFEYAFDPMTETFTPVQQLFLPLVARVD